MSESPHVTITRLVMPGQANFHGSLFGGVVLSLMDEAAAVLATRVAKGACVTAHIASVDFQAPIWVGEAVQVTARLIKIGNTSMRLRVSAVGENLATGTHRQCTEAEFVMVATDKEGRPRPVPKLETHDERNGG